MQNRVRNLASISPKFDIKITVWVVKKHSNCVSYNLKEQPYSLQIRLDPSPEFLSQWFIIYQKVCTKLMEKQHRGRESSFHLGCGSRAHWHSRTADISWPIPQNKSVLLMLLTMSSVSLLLLSAAAPAAKATLWLWWFVGPSSSITLFEN